MVSQGIPKSNPNSKVLSQDLAQDFGKAAKPSPDMLSVGAAFLLIVLCFSSIAQAVSMTGYVKVTDQGLYLQTPGNTDWIEMRAGTAEAKRTLDRMNSQDFVQGQGDFSGSVFVMKSVDFVGLYNLLGPWHSKSDRALVNFESFNTVSIFNPRTLGYDRVAIFDYSVAPDSGSHWKMFVSGNKKVSIASLKVEQNRLVLQFINLDTGAFEKPLELVRKNP